MSATNGIDFTQPPAECFTASAVIRMTSLGAAGREVLILQRNPTTPPRRPGPRPAPGAPERPPNQGKPGAVQRRLFPEDSADAS